jgi:hypothetical protein
VEKSAPFLDQPVALKSGEPTERLDLPLEQRPIECASSEQ